MPASKTRKKKGRHSQKPAALFGPFIIQLRNGSALSRPKFAEAVGVAETNLSKWENDRSIPKREHWETMLALQKPEPLAMAECLRYPDRLNRLREMEERIKTLEAKIEEAEAGAGRPLAKRFS